MRPPPGLLPRAARLRNSPSIALCQRATTAGTAAPCRHYRAAGTLDNVLPSRCHFIHGGRYHSPSLLLSGYTPSTQRRCITQQHIARTKNAEKEWATFAKEIKAGKRKDFAQHLEDRGLLHDVVGEKKLLHDIFTNKRVGLYAGVDPTAPSLHVGHLLPFMVLAWGYVWGLPVTFLLGGATAKVGDPSGRLKGREQTHSSIRKANMASMHMQLKKFGESAEQYGIRHGYKKEWVWRRALANNNIWWNKTTFLEVLRELGAHTRLGPMLGRDTVKTRLSSGEGMSFAEFSYPLMQAWDWWTLFKNGVQVQVGGADQYGNILFGMDAVKMISRNTMFELDNNPLENDLDKPIGLTTPLLTTASGEKFGKSAGNAIWLDKDMTSTFELYQFFVRTPDDTVERYLKMLTFLPLDEIARIMAKQTQDPSQRVAQHALASEIVELIHGKAEADAVALQHRQLFRPRASTAEPSPLPGKTGLSPAQAKSATAHFSTQQAGNTHAPQVNFANMPSAHVTLPRSLVYNQTFNKILWSAGLVSSKSEGHRVIANNGASVGSRPGDSGPMSEDLAFTPIRTWTADKTEKYILGGDLLILKLGKWKMKIVKIVSDEEFNELGLTAPGWGEAADPEEPRTHARSPKTKA